MKVISVIFNFVKASGTPYKKNFKAVAVISTSFLLNDPYPNNAFTISSDAKINPKLAGIEKRRDSSKDSSLISLTLEHYPGMSEATLEEIAQKAKKEWPIDSITIVHRVGRLKPEEMIVFVGCASAHRHAAFDGCQYIMDYLKTDAPFWKAEETKDGRTWVSERENDKAAKRRWHLEESN